MKLACSNQAFTSLGVIGVGGDVGAGLLAHGQINEVFNIGDNNLNYAGLFVSLNAAAAAKLGLSGGGAYVPNQEGNLINYWLPDLESAYSIGIGVAGGIGIAGTGSVVEYIPLFTLGPGDEFMPHAGWYLFENEQQWFVSQGIAELIGLLANYADFNPEDYNWGE